MKTIEDLTERQWEILLHALGIRGRIEHIKDSYRNRFVARQPSEDYDCCVELSQMGFMRLQHHYTTEQNWPDYLFSVTARGERLVGEHLEANRQGMFGT